MLADDPLLRGGEPFDLRQIYKHVLELVEGEDTCLLGGLAVLRHPEHRIHMPVLDGLDLELECVSEGGNVVQGLWIVEQLFAFEHVPFEVSGRELGVAAGARQVLGLLEGVLDGPKDLDRPVGVI